MTIGERIKQKRTELSLNQVEFADKINVSKQTLYKYENNIITNIPSDKIELIAKVLHVSPAYIMGWDNITDIPALHSDVFMLERGMKIPVLGEVAAGRPIFAEENYIGFEEIPKELALSGEFFALKIKGDSMSPRIMEGDTVIVKQQDDAESGNIVIVLINGDTATCKRLMKYQEGISLISFNPAYEPITFTNKEIEEKPVKIIGKVVENRQKW